MPSPTPPPRQPRSSAAAGWPYRCPESPCGVPVPPMPASALPSTPSRRENREEGWAVRSISLCRLQQLQISQHFVAMTLRTHLQVDLPDHARRIDQKGVSGGKRHAVVFHDRAVFLHHYLARIGQQLEVQPLFCAEAFMRIHVVHADAHDHRILRRVFIDVALEIVSLDRAARSKVLGIEVKHHPLALELIQRHLRAFLAGQTESRRRTPGNRRLRLVRGHRRKRSQSQCQNQNRKQFHNAPSELLISIKTTPTLWQAAPRACGRMFPSAMLPARSPGP